MRYSRLIRSTAAYALAVALLALIAFPHVFAGTTINTSINTGGSLTVGGGATISGGAASITGGTGAASTAGNNALLQAGAGGTGNAAGGSASLIAGAGSGTENGGAGAFTAGAGGATAKGGAISIASGAGGSTSGQSGSVSILSGNTTSGNSGSGLFATGTATAGVSGAIDIRTGGTTGNNASGALNIEAGITAGTAAPGTITVGSSTAPTGAAAGGAIVLRATPGGTATAAGLGGGTITLTSGAGTAGASSSNGAGGLGGNVSVTTGVGGAGDGSGAGTSGGTVSFTTGVGGAGGASGGNGGNGGNITYTLGRGGNTASGAATAGVGGAVTYTLGTGGAGTVGAGAGGTGGAFTVAAGNGGVPNTSADGNGGDGGKFDFDAGSGAAANSTGAGGSGGNVEINSGAGGANTKTSGGGSGGSGGAITITTGAAGTTTSGMSGGSGGGFTVTTGSGAGGTLMVNPSGSVLVQSGDGGAGGATGSNGGASGNSELRTGSGGAGSGSGNGGTAGIAYLSGGNGGSTGTGTGGTGGQAIVQGGGGGSPSTGRGTGGAGGAITISGGGGGQAIQSGSGTNVAGDGGGVTINAGGAGSVSGGTTNTGANGGDVSISAGSGTVAGQGGDITLTAGQGGATGTAGILTITSGAGGSTSGASGALTIATGAATSGAAGDILIQMGTATTGTNTNAITIDAKNESDGVRIIAGDNESATSTSNGNDIELLAEDDVLVTLKGRGSLNVDATTTPQTGLTGAVDIDFASGTTGAEGVNVFANSTSSADNDLIAGIIVDLDDDSSSATSGLYGLRIDSSDITGSAGVVGVYLDSGAPGLEFGMILEDDLGVSLGTPGDVGGTGTAALLYETADANANELLLALPEGGSTDVPVLAIGDQTSENRDLAFFDGVTDPTLAMISNDGGDYGRIYVENDGDFFIDNVTSGADIYVTSADDVVIQLAAGGNFQVDGTSTAHTSTTGAVDVDFRSSTTGAEAVNISAGTASAADNDLIAGIVIELDDDSSSATSGLYGVRIDAVDVTGSAGVTGIYLDSGSPGLELGLVLEDDLDVSFGTPADVGGTGTAAIRYETADANANELVINLPDGGGGTDVPVLVISDGTTENRDLGFFNGITDPTLAIVSNDAGDYGRFYVEDDGDFYIDNVTSGADIYVTSADDVVIELAAGGNFTIDGTTTAHTSTIGAADVNFRSSTTGAEAVNISAGTASAADNDLIAGIVIELDDDSSSATSGLYGIRIDAVDVTGSAGVTGIYMDSGSPGLELGLVLEDDLDVSFGTPADVGGTGTAAIRYETVDANANVLMINLPEGGGTDVPVLVVADQTSENRDLGFFNGVTDTTIALVSNDGGDQGKIVVEADGDMNITHLTSGADMYVTSSDDIFMQVDTLTIESSANSTLGQDFALFTSATSTLAADITTQGSSTSTTRVTGFFYLNVTDGLPTGDLYYATGSSTSAMTYDIANNKLCMNEGVANAWLCSGALTDIAEWVPAAGASSGDLVSTTDKANPVVGEDPTAPFMLGRSSGAYDDTLVGVISEYAEETQSANGYKHSSDYHAMTLAGRVPVNVTGENGAINPGDYITSSSIPGKGMKATRPGRVIGIALNSFSGESGQVMVQVFNTFWNGPAGAGLQGGDVTTTGLQGSLEDVKSVKTDKLVVQKGATFFGKVTFKGSAQFDRQITVGGDTAGTVVLKGGEKSARVSFGRSYVKATPVVTATPQGNAGSFWVSDVGPKGFTVNVAKAPSADVTFNWISLGSAGAASVEEEE